MQDPIWTGVATLRALPTTIDTSISINQPLPAGATGIGGKYSSLYLEVPGPRGLEAGQLFTGGGVGLVIRTNPNTGPSGATGAAFPIRLAPNNNETLVLNPDKSATFFGNVSVLGTASLSNLSLLNASIDTNQPARFRSGVTVDGNMAVGATGTSTQIVSTSLRCNASSLFTNEVLFNNLAIRAGNPYLRLTFPQTTIPGYTTPETYTPLNMLATRVTDARGILDRALWVDTPNKAIRIPYSGLWSINVRTHWNATQAATFQQLVYLKDLQSYHQL